MNPVTLAAADAYCRELTRRHYENFLVASPLVGADRRLDLARIYAFCRTTDDFGDESGSREEALDALERWRGELHASFGGRMPAHPVLIALRETIVRRSIPAQPFFDLIEANRLDQRAPVYETWEQLDAYCRLSAAPVGRMVLSIFGVTDARAHGLSDDVCIGLQLANHAQDVKRDAEIGRRYLPAEDIAAYGTKGAVRALVERARRLLDSGRTLEGMVPLALRLQLRLYRMGGLAICSAIERLGYGTDAQRPTVGGGERAVILLRAVSGA
ncbi:MAG TPA: squalene/phytoene synthase family protein [Candidatus Baltobacteraceae bacterium]|nr:squalene/phytoene synthase family protein [Candidatus Baltobacteraceae bacterium]